MERRSRWAAMNVRRSEPSTVGGIKTPELERSRGCWPVLGPAVADVAALTAEARRA